MSSVNSLRKVTDKLHDFLMNPKSRPDLQTPEGQRWLSLLQHHQERVGPKMDSLTPWLTREWKKGRLHHSEDGRIGHAYYHRPVRGHPDAHERVRVMPEHYSHWADFLQSQHPVRRQLGDIMQHDLPSFRKHVGNWDEAMERDRREDALANGRVVHTTPDDWTVQRLVDPAELKAEGDAMGHCVGGYSGLVGRGDTMIYSLRDPEGHPHVTTEITPKYVDWRGQRISRDHLDTLAPMDEEDARGGEIPHQGTVVQIQGRSNQEPKDEYKARLADWFRSFPHEDRPRWDDDGTDGYIHDYEGYGHSSIDHPDLIPKWEQENGGLANRTEPTEDEYGLLRPPNAMDADYDDLLSNIKYRDYGSSGGEYDGTHMDDIYRLATERGEIPQFATALEGWQQEQQENFDNWVDMNYEYMPRYPDPDDPHGYEDEDGEGADETTPGARPYWEPEGSSYGERYYDTAEAEKAYDEAYANTEREHPGMNAVNYLYNKLNQHAFNSGGYQNEPKPTAQPAEQAEQAEQVEQGFS